MPSINNNDIKLMLAIIGTAENLKTDNDRLSKIVGDGSTPNAIRQRVQKIKQQAKALLAGESVDIGGTPVKTPVTPAKRQASASEGTSNDQTSPSKKRSTGKINASSSKGNSGHKTKNREDGLAVKIEKDDGVDESPFGPLIEDEA